MSGSANVSLSAFEQQLVTDAGFILTKNGIISKVYQLFGQLSAAWQAHSSIHQLPAEIIQSSPRISKGENYAGLPYVMLDYPRYFSKEHVFAIRTFFWWGHFFSITLQLKGQYKEQYGPSIADAIKTNQCNGAWINTGDEEWAHHFEPTNMKLVELTDADMLMNKEVIKLAYKLDLNQWDNAEEFLSAKFDEIVQMLKISYYFQDDERDL